MGNSKPRHDECGDLTMAVYELPLSIEVGTLTLPQFLAEHFAKHYNGDIQNNGFIDCLETANLAVPMAEISFVNADRLPNFVQLLMDCSIPFHYNFTLCEDMEFDYFYGFTADAGLQGNDSTQGDWGQYEPYIDEAVLNSNLQKLVTQFKLLGGDIFDFLETMEMRKYDFYEYPKQTP